MTSLWLSHVGEGERTTVAREVAKFGVLGVEGLRLGFERGYVDAPEVALHFVEVGVLGGPS